MLRSVGGFFVKSIDFALDQWFDEFFFSHKNNGIISWSVPIMETIPERPVNTAVQVNQANQIVGGREQLASNRNSRPQTEADLRSKEQRRRERRERRAARRQQHNYGHFRDPFTIYGSVYGANMPDILNSHMPPPPYSTLPHSTSRSSRNQPPGPQGGPQLPEVRAVRSATARARRWRPLPALAGATTDLTR